MINRNYMLCNACNPIFKNEYFCFINYNFVIVAELYSSYNDIKSEIVLMADNLSSEYLKLFLYLCVIYIKETV